MRSMSPLIISDKPPRDCDACPSRTFNGPDTAPTNIPMMPPIMAPAMDSIIIPTTFSTCNSFLPPFVKS